ncbi:MAG: bacteriohemerythrin [Lachnospiraceae bacterium]|nr:bacteriohemerythrin [Lachnospiraceae bacterium]
MFTFTKDCLIGVPEIDEEHKTLFELISKTDSALKAGDGSIAEALTLLNELKQYAKNHFAHEEAYMEEIHDAELERQRTEHVTFIEKINTYSFSDVTNENARAIMLELLEFLSKWLMGHILGSDILIGYFKADKRPEIPVFTDAFKTGIAIVDDEHQKLFEIIGNIHKAINADLLHDKFDAILDILDELKEYTQVHFADEENYMKEIGYDGLAYQEILHQNFIDKLNELDLDDVDDNQEAYLYDFLGFLQNWLVNHILKVDKLIPQQ